MLGLWVLQIRLFYLPKVIHYVRDGWTDGRTEATLNAPFLTRGGIIMSLKTIALTVYSGNVIHFMCLAKSCYLLYVYCCIVITDNSCQFPERATDLLKRFICLLSVVCGLYLNTQTIVG